MDEFKTLINNITQIEELLEQISRIKDNTVKGTMFEWLGYYILKVHPLYINEFDAVYMYKDIPTKIKNKLKLPDKDKGIDLLCVKGNDYTLVQCKYRTNKSTNVTWDEIGTFLASFKTHGVVNGIYISNCFDVCKELLLPENKKSIKLIINSFFESVTPEIITSIKQYIDTNKIQVIRKEPRDYQLEIIQAAVNHYKTETLGQLLMACGTGKSLTSCFIVEELKCKDVIIVVPSLMLLSQILLEYAQQNIFTRYLLIGSDISDDSKKFIDGMTLVCDQDSITKWVTKNILEKRLVITTYQSGEYIKKALIETKQEFDICIYDEAHKTTGNIDKQFSLLLDDTFKVKKRMFMTATPKSHYDNDYFDENTNEDLDDEDLDDGDLDEDMDEGTEDDDMDEGTEEDMDEDIDDVTEDGELDEDIDEETEKETEEDTEEEKQVKKTKYCMNDESIYGKIIFELGLRDAINRKLLVDYEIVTLLTTNEQLKKYMTKNKIMLVEQDNEKYDATMISSALLLLKNMHSNPKINKVLTYHNTIKEAQSFSRLLNLFSKNYIELKQCCISYLDGSITVNKRRVILNKFKEHDKSVICSAKVLTEGINIPCVDTVVFVASKSSYIDIIQCVGRAMRLYETKELCYILIPTLIENGECNNSYKHIWAILRGLNEGDPNVLEYFKEIKKNGVSTKINRSSNSLTDVKNNVIDLFLTDMNQAVWKYIDNWDYMYDKLVTFLETEKRRPNSNSKIDEERRLGQWISTQEKKYKKCIESMKTIERRHLWDNFKEKYHQFFTDNDMLWDQMYEKLVIFLETNKKKPVKESVILDEKQLGIWIGNQYKNHKNNKMTQKRINKWTELINTYKQFLRDNDKIWNDNLILLETFIETEKRRPNKESNILEERMLGNWTCNQLKYYRNKKILVGERLNKWTNFIINYAKYFKNDDELWITKLEDMMLFIDTYKRKPTKSKDKTENSLSNWYHDQLKKRINIPDRQKLWDDFTNKYKEYLLNQNELWYMYLGSLKSFIDTHKRKPMRNSSDENEKFLGSWFNTNKKKYKKEKELLNTITKKNKQINEQYKIWEQFINIYKEYF